MNTSRERLGQAIRLKEVYAACLCVMLGVAPAYGQQASNTSVGNFQSQVGGASVAASVDPAKVVINLSSNKSVLQWDRLQVPIGATLQFSQPNAQSVVLNRVVSVDPARIDGVMNSNGQVWLLSGSGVLFGPNSQVNVQGLLASTRNISNADFLAGNYSFNGGGAGKVSNLGDLTVADGGYVLLVGSEVDNQGRIQAQLGQVKLASGKAFVLDLNGDKLLRFDVTEALGGADGQAAAVTNAGQIVADGGAIQLTARAANGLVAQVVNTGGLLQANSARWVNGDIVLDAGPGGEVAAGGQISAQGLEAGTKGGNVTVLGDAITLTDDARINASGQTGGGKVLVGGDWQGSGSLQQASTVDMQAGAQIKANATTAGDGGKVVLWSTATDPTTRTTVAGDIEARGAGGGRGGQIETSGGQLEVSGNVAAGAGGHWLLDPTDVVVDNALSTSIVNSLNNATDVTVQASGGELRVESDVTTTGTGNATLTLDGTNATNVSIQRRVTVTDAMNVVVNSGGDVRFDSNNSYYSSGIQTVSGNITINANDYLFTTTRNSGDLAALKTQSGTISTTSRVAVLGHGAIDVTGAGKATVLTTGVSRAGEGYALPAGLGLAFYLDGTTVWSGYGSKYADGANSIVRIRGAGSVLINATQGLVTSGNYSDGSNTFTAYDPASRNDPVSPTLTGFVNRVLKSDASSGSFVLAGPEISIPQWVDLGNVTRGYVYDTTGGTLGFVSMDTMSAQVGNYNGASVDKFFAIVNIAPTTATVTSDGTTHSSSGVNSLVQLASVSGIASSVSGGVPSTALSMTSRTQGVGAGTQKLVIDSISFNNIPFFSLPITTSKSITVQQAPAATPAVEQAASQSVQIAVASATSSLSQLASTASVTPTTTTTQPSATTATTATTTPTTQTETTSTAGTTTDAASTTPAVAATAQAGTTPTTQASTTAATTETASISVTSQPAQTTNLNAANTTTTPTQTAAATGTAATEAKPQVTMVSMAALSVNAPTAVGAQTIAAIQTPTAPEDQRDPVLAAVSSFKPPVVLSATSARAPAAKGQTQQVVVPLVQGVLALETVPPKAASQTVDEQRLSGAGNRSRW